MGSAPKSGPKYLSVRTADAPAPSDLSQLHELIQDSVQAAEYPIGIAFFQWPVKAKDGISTSSAL